jgi:membrane protein DedA with SNARE-associated domain
MSLDPAILTELLTDWGYPALLALLCATGIGSPIPEDLLLLAGGYLISAGVFSWRVTLPLAVTGVVASDLILYLLGRRMRTRQLSGWAERIIPMHRLRRSAPWFASAGAAAVLAARLVPGTRAVVFISAGLQGIRPSLFLLFDVIGSLLWVPFLLWVGTQIGEEIGGIGALLAGISRAAFWIALGGVLLLLAWRFWRTEESKL